MSLYDPNEFPETTVGPDFSLGDVLAWARTKPAGEAYRYGDIFGCALCQYFDGRGVAFRSVGGTEWRGPEGEVYPIPNDVADALGRPPFAFGAFADRLEKALS